MDKFSKVVSFIIEHRRPIGMIVGGLLSLCGMGDILNGSMD